MRTKGGQLVLKRRRQKGCRHLRRKRGPKPPQQGRDGPSRAFKRHLVWHLGVNHLAPLHPSQQRGFGLYHSRRGKSCAIKQASDLVRRLAFAQHQPCQQPIAGAVTSPQPCQPPAQPRPMAKQCIKQFKDRPSVGILKMTLAPKPARGHRIRRTRGALNFEQKIEGGLQAGGRGHGADCLVESAAKRRRGEAFRLSTGPAPVWQIRSPDATVCPNE